MAALRPALLMRPAAGLALGATALAGLADLVDHWPATPGWWRRDVWWETETAREGMGMTIVVAAPVLAALVAIRVRRRASSACGPASARASASPAAPTVRRASS